MNRIFLFLGSTSDTLNVLQTEGEDVFLSESLVMKFRTGSFENEVVDLQLNSVVGPGEVFLYRTDAFGSPSVFVNSSDGIDENDALPISVGSHSHLNWAFSSPGIYRVGVTASGTLVTNSQTVSSETVELTFEVFAPTILEEGEYDIEVVYEEGEWEIAVLDEANELEFSADEVVFAAGSESQQTIDPTLGLNAASLYIFPQTENPDLPFIGVAGDAIESGVFQNEKVAFELVSLSGPGDFFLYALDSFGNLAGNAPYFDSSNGINASDIFPV